MCLPAIDGLDMVPRQLTENRAFVGGACPGHLNDIRNQNAQLREECSSELKAMRPALLMMNTDHRRGFVVVFE